MTPEKIRELIGKLRWLEKDTRDDLAAKRCNEAADALEHLLQFVEWKPIESAPKDEKVIRALLYTDEEPGYFFWTLDINEADARTLDRIMYFVSAPPFPPAPSSHREEKE